MKLSNKCMLITYADSLGKDLTDLSPFVYPGLMLTWERSGRFVELTDDVVQIDGKGAMTLVGHKRSEVHLISKNGQKVFKGAMTLHVEELKKIKRYQYVQTEAGKAELCIVQDTPMTGEEINRVKDYIQRRCEGLLDVEIKFVDEVQLTSRGKYQWAVCRIK